MHLIRLLKKERILIQIILILISKLLLFQMICKFNFFFMQDIFFNKKGLYFSEIYI
jgi:hypothetical protein